MGMLLGLLIIVLPWFTSNNNLQYHFYLIPLLIRPLKVNNKVKRAVRHRLWLALHVKKLS